MKVTVNKDKCPKNHKCRNVEACPKGAITQEGRRCLPSVDEKLCSLCGKCVKFCPKGAFEMA